jgi:arylsulfatase A-like enzyme
MGSDYNYDQGFDNYYEHYKNDGEKLISGSGVISFLTDSSYRERKLNDMIAGSDNGAQKKFDLLEKTIQSSQEPYFIMANFIECHSSYSAPRPYTEEIDSGFSRPKYAILERLNVGSRSHRDPEIQLEKLTDYREAINRQYSNPDYLSEKELETWKKWYAAELKYLDDQLGSFIDSLKHLGVLDDTLLIFTSDHGELFGEHDLVYHNNFLWDKLLHVPLILYDDDLPSDTQDETFSIVDLFPTICDLVDINKPDDIDGQSLFSKTVRKFSFAEIGERDISIINRDTYLNTEQKNRFDRGKKAVWDQQLKYIRYSDGTEDAYMMPSEKPASEREDHVNRLRKELQETLGEKHPTSPEKEHQVSESTLKNLEELGYR